MDDKALEALEEAVHLYGIMEVMASLAHIMRNTIYHPTLAKAAHVVDDGSLELRVQVKEDRYG